MTPIERVLPHVPLTTLDIYLEAGGRAGVERATNVGPDAVIDAVNSSGLRGRGGAGFPTGRKWRTVREYATGAADPTTVVVNGAEGEPGSYKDRSIMRANPFAVLEGAIIAATVVGAERIVIALKTSFSAELAIMRDAVDAVAGAGWCDGITIEVFAGPAAYLLGEETGLLEAIDGRPPFPRIAPPFRRGIDETVGSDAPGYEVSRSAADLELAGPNRSTTAAPTLVDNVETMANVPAILREGPEWFRSIGTEQSPGSIVCTVSGESPSHGVGEFAMGTSLRSVLETVGGVEIDRVGAVLVGVSSAVLRRNQLDVPLTYEDLDRIGSGLGTAGFIVYDESADLLQVASGVARFLAVESCGQCTPCKSDGRVIAEGLATVVARESDPSQALEAVRDALETVADSARCNLASQQQAVVGSLLDGVGYEDALATPPPDPAVSERSPLPPIAGIRDLVGDRFVLDTDQAGKQFDWSSDDIDSGQAPADRLGATMEPVTP